MEYVLFLIGGLIFGFSASIICVWIGSKMSQNSISPFVYSDPVNKENTIEGLQKEVDENLPYDWGAAEEDMKTKVPWEEEENSDPSEEDFDKV
jgi:hypothetical protein